MKYEFKKGDKLKVIRFEGRGLHFSLSVGDVVTCEEDFSSDDSEKMVSTLRNGVKVSSYSGRLELATVSTPSGFNVGDRVRCVGGKDIIDAGWEKGLVFEITSLTNNGEMVWGGRNGNGVWIRNLEPVSTDASSDRVSLEHLDDAVSALDYKTDAEFKVGDRIEVVNAVMGEEYSNGDRGTVIVDDGNSYPEVEFDAGFKGYILEGEMKVLRYHAGIDYEVPSLQERKPTIMARIKDLFKSKEQKLLERYVYNGGGIDWNSYIVQKVFVEANKEMLVAEAEILEKEEKEEAKRNR